MHCFRAQRVLPGVLLALGATSLPAQTIDDGLMMPRRQLCTGFVYMHDSWDRYWEGLLERGNGNIGTVTAQSGSSGGVVANAWGRAIGLITTMSEGKTTSERTLRALTLSYIDADLVAQTGGTLADFLAGNHYQMATSFMEIEGGELADLLVNQIIK